VSVASLVVAVVSAGVALYALRWARRSAQAAERSAIAAERAAAAEETAADASRSALEMDRERDRLDRLANVPNLELQAVFDAENRAVICYLHNHGPKLASDVHVVLRDQTNEIVLRGEATISALKVGGDDTVRLPVPIQLLEALRPSQLRVEEAFRPFGTFVGPDLEQHGIQHTRWLERDHGARPAFDT
jgi:hypothetical protein